MNSEMTALKEKLRPTSKPRMIDLVASAGFDVGDWGNFKGGWQNAATNPKYCYEWCYQQEGMFILNIWYENMSFESALITQSLNLRTRLTDTAGNRRVRARRFDEAVRDAYEKGSNPRAIIQHRSTPGRGGVETRLLDSAPWTVVRYNDVTGDFVLQRGIVAEVPSPEDDGELQGFQEGEVRRRFILHRRREGKLRTHKLAAARAANSGHLICEVANCAFNFAESYGDLGYDYAQVHHITPLSELNEAGETVTLDDLAVVCANCHAMIHRGGACRTLREISEAMVHV